MLQRSLKQSGSSEIVKWFQNCQQFSWERHCEVRSDKTTQCQFSERNQFLTVFLQYTVFTNQHDWWTNCVCTIMVTGVGLSRSIWTPLKLVPPGTNFFWNIWAHSEKFVPTVHQLHQGNSVHVNGHEVTTKDISGVHNGICRKLSDWFSSVCLSWPKNFAMYTEHAVQPGGLYIVCCWTYAPVQFPETSITLLEKPPAKIL